MKSNKKRDVIIYQAKSGAIKLKGDFGKETIWATQAQIATAFDVNIPTTNEHIKNILKTQELSEKSTVRNFRIVQSATILLMGMLSTKIVLLKIMSSF